MRIDIDTCRDPDLLAGEVRRLRAVIASEQRLTDAERDAVETAFDAMQYAADELGLSQADCDRLVATLRGLLDRTDTGGK